MSAFTASTIPFTADTCSISFSATASRIESASKLTEFTASKTKHLRSMLITTLVVIIIYLIIVGVTVLFFFMDTDYTCLKCSRAILPIIIWLMFLICEILVCTANGQNKDNIEYLNGLASLKGCIPETYVY